MSDFQRTHRGERLRPLMRVSLLLLAAILAIVTLGTAAIEAQLPAHKFYGFGSQSTVDGVALDEGSVVYAWNQRDVLVGTGVLRDGLWDLDVDPASASAVRFSIDESGLSGWNDVNGGSLTEINLSLTAASPALSVDASASPLPDRAGFERYTILQGDTLGRIAERFDLTVGEIMAANPQLANAHQIRLGDPLFLPQGAALASAGATGEASSTGVANGSARTASSASTPGGSPQDGGDAAPAGASLPLRADSDFWAWLAIGVSIAAMVIGVGGAVLARRRRLQAERRVLARAAMPAALAPDLTPPPVYRTLGRGQAQAPRVGPFGPGSPQPEGARQAETFSGGD